MDTLQKAIQLSEEISFPDGCNVVEVEGTGDEPYLQYIPKITVTVTPASVLSDGETFFTCTAEIDDPNDPDAGNIDLQVEDGSAGVEDNIYSYSTSMLCTQIQNPSTSGRPSVIGSTEWNDWCRAQSYGLFVWTGGEDEDTYTYGACLEITKLEDDGHTIQFNPDYIEGYVPEKLICHYKGGNSVSWSTGGIDADNSGTVDEDEEDDVTGEFWTTANTSTGIQRDESVINQNSSTIYFLPEPGSSGKLTIHASYGSGSDYVEVSVKIGYLGNATLDHSADPSSIGVGGESQLTATLSSTDSIPLNGYTIVWKVLGGVGSVSPNEAATSAGTSQEEDMDTSVENSGTSKRWQFTTSYPVSKVNSIKKNTLVDVPAWTWDGKELEIDGTTVKFNEETTLPLDEYPITVDYDWSGVAQTTYTCDEPCDTVIVSASVKDTTLNKNVTLSVGGDVASNLTLTAEPTEIDREDSTDPEAVKESTLTAVYTDGEGNGATGNVTLHFSRGGGDLPTSISLRPATIENEKNSASSRYEVSTKYPINGVTNVLYPAETGDNYYTGGSYEASTITLGIPLPAPGLEVSVTYKNGGTGTATYKSRAKDEVVDIYGIAPDGSRASCSITVGDPDATYPADVTFNDVQPDPVDADHVAQIQFTMKGEGDVILPSGENYATIWLSESQGWLVAGKYDDKTWPKSSFGQKVGSSSVSAPVALEGDTENEPGTGWVSYRAPKDKECDVKICGKHKDTSEDDIYKSNKEGSTTFKVRFYVTTYEEVEQSIGSVTVSFNVKTKDYSTSPGWVSIWDAGAGGEAEDETGGYTGDPSIWPMKLLLTPTVNPPANCTLSYKKIDGGKAILSATDTPNSYGCRAEIPWTWEENLKKYIVEVTAKNDPDSPVSYADVTILGTTVKTDVDGKAEFQALPIGTHPIYIKSSNYKWNREPEVGGTGEDYDVDPVNDTITVENYSEHSYILDNMEETFDLVYVYKKAISEPPEEEENPQ